MDTLPLFHRISGQPVIVLGHGEAAAAKRRLVERAGGIVVDDSADGIDRGARIAFVAHDDETSARADALRLRCAGVLVNVVDRPELCDFTTPSVVDRNPVLIAVGTGGASAGLAKAVRLRIDRLLPARLGALARALSVARGALRQRWPDGRERRAALDRALEEGGALDPLRSESADAVAGWLDGAEAGTAALVEAAIEIGSDDPDDLTLRQARLLGQADVLVLETAIAPAILARARADAVRVSSRPGLQEGGPERTLPERTLVVRLRRSAESRKPA